MQRDKLEMLPTVRAFSRAFALAMLALTPMAIAQSLLELNALIQEGDLILEEAAALAPSNDKLTKEGQATATSDKALREDLAAVKAKFAAYNAATDELNQEIATHNVQCPRQMEDAALLESCNANSKELNARIDQLRAQLPPIEEEQKRVFERIDVHNKANTDFATRQKQQDNRNLLNQHDAEEWLARVRPFLSSDDFQTMLRKAAEPFACSQGRLAPPAPLPLLKTLKHVQECLKSVQRAVK